MKYQCDLVQDLLPLYQDHICSEASRQIVEEHLQECEKCSGTAKQMQDVSLENQLTDERNVVLSAHRKQENRKSVMIGVATGGILLIPVIVCLICNIAIGHALDWFFIVLTAMLLAASLLVVPLVAANKKLLWTLLCGTGSLMALLLTCCIYTGGNWFFVAAAACLLGISIFFAPYVVNQIPLPQKLQKNKALLVFLWDSLWLYLLLIVCGIFVHGGEVYWRIALVVPTYIILLLFLWILVLRYLHRNAWTRAGILSMITGIWIGAANDVLNLFLPPPGGYGLKYLDLSKGFDIKYIEAFNANIFFVVIVLSIFLGAVFLFLGFLKRKEKTDENN